MSAFPSTIRILGNGNVSFFFYNGKKWVVCTTKQTKVGDGRWHHIVGQKTARRLEVYVDGVLKATVAQGGAPVARYKSEPSFFARISSHWVILILRPPRAGGIPASYKM